MNALCDATPAAAIERVYRERYRQFLRLAVAMLGDADRAGDAVQEAFARALRSQHDLRRLETTQAWLWQTLVNVCRMELRRRVDSVDEIDQWDVTFDRGDSSEVRSLIATLPERQRLVLFLRHYADLDYLRIAEVLEIERGTVAAALNAAHRKIREAMTEAQR